ncbi:MAG: CHAT domain-containing tetratricopeptide repeat protein [Acidobacteriaceae bacterium]
MRLQVVAFLSLLLSIPLYAQSPPTPSAPAASDELPAAAQQKLASLEAKLAAAKAANNPHRQADALNQIGDFYMGISRYQKALDSCTQALALARAANDEKQQAAILNGQATAWRRLAQNDKALAASHQALALATHAGDLLDQAIALTGVASADFIAGQNQKALDLLNQALPIAQKSSDQKTEAIVLRSIGVVDMDLSQTQPAIDYLNRSLVIFRRIDDGHDRAVTLNNLGNLYREESDWKQALDAFNQALPFFHDAGDLDGEANILANTATVYRHLGQPQKAIDLCNQALPVYRRFGDLDGESATLNNLGNVYLGLGESQKALDAYNQALPINRQLGNRFAEAQVLTNMGLVYEATGSPQKSLDVLEQALTIFRQVDNPAAEAGVLNSIGIAYEDLSQPQKALDAYNQVLTVARQLHRRNLEALSLNNLGVVYKRLGEPQKALDYDNQALAVNREIGDRANQASNLANIGLNYVDLGDPQKALDYDNQALLLSRQVGDRNDEAAVLVNMGNIYGKLGQPQKALDYFNQALPVQHQIAARDDEARTLNNIGLAYSDLGDKQKTLDYYGQALDLYRQVGDPDGQADVLNDRGFALTGLGDPRKALDDLNQALVLYRQAGDLSGQANTLTNTGVAYSKLGDKQKSLDHYAQALPLAGEIADPFLQALICYYMMDAHSAAEPALAIFFGKQAINYLQKVRGNLQGMDSGLEKSFLTYKDSYYHDLAKLLIDQGRLPEAQQVLDLLKQQEYTEYVRGASNDGAGAVSLTPAEEQAQADYEKATAQLVSVSDQWSQLKKLAARTPDQQQQYQQLSDALAKANQALNDYYARLYKLFGQGSEANKQVADVKGDAATLRDQIAHTPHAVALYTVLTADRYSVLGITGNAMVAREYAISEENLNPNVAAFQQVLRDPRSDPRPLAQDLYTILIGPIQADLDQAHAQTLVWSLDGVLRYIPMAALYDGKYYLVEKYGFVSITPASIGRLADQPRMASVKAVAMGISRQYEQDLQPLPAVVGELDDIVRDPQVDGAHGVLPGSILLNGQFTEKAMERQLDAAHPIVHIASHFVFHPGDDSNSWLLLAGKDADTSGYHLTVAEFRDNPNLRLDDTALLTLSACETGVGGNAGNGREVDGLAMTAQLKGAQAVLSSLWEVNDTSTGQLMADFYKRWAGAGGNTMKVDALRKAQLDLLRGKATGKQKAAGRGVQAIDAGPQAPAGFAHPYYWAPFILVGNWK